MYAGGDHKFGQIGVGVSDVDKMSRPKCIGNFNKRVKRVYCGYYSTIILTSHNELYSFGRNHRGQLGLGDYVNRDVPTKISFNFISPIKQVDLGADHSLVLTTTGNVYAFGGNGLGQLGLGHRNRMKVPQKIENFNTSHVLIKLIACGGNHTVLISTQNDIYVFGNNKFGQLGIESKNHNDNSLSNSYTFPKLIHLNKTNSHIKDVKCGFFFTIILTTKGELFSSGENTFGTLGINHTKHLNQFQKIAFPISLGTISSLSCGDDHVMLITSQNDIFGWGRNSFGQLALPKQSQNEKVMITKPSKVNLFANEKVQKVACGGNFTYILTDKALYSCGSNKYDQMLRSTKEGSKSLVGQIVGFNGNVDHDASNEITITNISCGLGHVILLSNENAKKVNCEKELRRNMSEIFDVIFCKADSFLDNRRSKYSLNIIRKEVFFTLFCKIRLRNLISLLNEIEMEENEKYCFFKFVFCDELCLSKICNNEIDICTYLNVAYKVITQMDAIQFEGIEIIYNFIYVLMNEMMVHLKMQIREFVSLVSCKKKVENFQEFVNSSCSWYEKCLEIYKIVQKINFHKVSKIIRMYIYMLYERIIRKYSVKKYKIPFKEEEVSVEIVSTNDKFLKTMNEKYFKEMLTLYNNGRYKANLHQNVALSCKGGNVIFVHSEIVYVRCELLRSLLRFRWLKNGKTKENQKKMEIIKMKFPFDIPKNEMNRFFNAFSEFIKYLYIGRIYIDAGNCILLLLIWNYMGMKFDHEICRQLQMMVSQNLNLSNVVKVIKVFVKEKDHEVVEELKNECFEFCVRNWKDLNKLHGKNIEEFIPFDMYINITMKIMNSNVSLSSS